MTKLNEHSNLIIKKLKKYGFKHYGYHTDINGNETYRLEGKGIEDIIYEYVITIDNDCIFIVIKGSKYGVVIRIEYDELEINKCIGTQIKNKVFDYLFEKYL